jgi:hypothetical protein
MLWALELFALLLAFSLHCRKPAMIYRQVKSPSVKVVHWLIPSVWKTGKLWLKNISKLSATFEMPVIHWLEFVQWSISGICQHDKWLSHKIGGQILAPSRLNPRMAQPCHKEQTAKRNSYTPWPYLEPKSHQGSPPNLSMQNQYYQNLLQGLVLTRFVSKLVMLYLPGSL